MIRVLAHCLTAISVVVFLSSTAASQQPNGAESKYVKYAENLVAKYDEDKDGKLSNAETKKMRRPPVGADLDKDGFITTAELVGSLSGKSRSSTKNPKIEDSNGSSNRRRSPSSRPQSSSSAQPNYARYEKYAESLIKNYDKDKDGKLNKEEINKMRRPPAEADVDNDGFVTKEELVGSVLLSRYDSDKDGKLSQSELVESLRSPSVRSPYRDRTPPKSLPRSSPDSSSQEKYERYVDSLLNQYDEDKDGQLSQEEKKKMRRPPTGADTNNDGLVSRDELINSLSGKAKNPPSEKSKPGPAKDQTEDGEQISRTQYTEAGAKHVLFSLGSWKWVQAETSKTLALSPVEMGQLRAAVTQFPTGNRYFVLAVAEYRMRNFQKAIDAAAKVADAPNDGEAQPRGNSPFWL